MSQTLAVSATRMAQLLRDRSISSAELVGAHLRQIERVNPRINAAVEVFAGRALAEASAADRRIAAGQGGPFEGVPFSVKDSMEIEGAVCTAGTLGRQHAPPAARDATLVARLRGAGAIPIARTNLPDLLFAFESENLLFGRTNNPYELAHTSGGSSGGEAALIASCGSPMGLGSDAAGSVRVPAAFCGIASIKPTSGRLPRAGHVPPAGGWLEALWQIGPMARHVEDLVGMMRLLVDPDGMPLGDTLDVNLRTLRAAFFTHDADAEVAAVVRAAAAKFPGEVHEFRPACLDHAYELEMKLIGPDGGDSFHKYLAAIGSTRAHPLLLEWIQRLAPYRTDVAGLQRYWQEWDEYRAQMTAFGQAYDVVLCPAYAHAGLLHGESCIEENFRAFHHTMAFNVAGWPAAVVRCGTSSEGLPIAVQIAAKPWREHVVLAVAEFLESALGGSHLRPRHTSFDRSSLSLPQGVRAGP